MLNVNFGVEIEGIGLTVADAANVLRNAGINAVAEHYNHETRRHWKVVSDASLYDASGSNFKTFEVVSPVLNGEDGIRELRAVCNALKAAGADANKSCGLHVHFDARDMKGTDVVKFLRRYEALEADIDSLLPLSRRGTANRYARSLKDTTIFDGLKIEDAVKNYQRIAGMDARYYKVNVQSYLRHGTVEVRHHSGAINADRIENWIRFMAAFIARSMECEGMAIAKGRADIVACWKAENSGTTPAGVSDVLAKRQMGLAKKARRSMGNVWDGVPAEVVAYYQARAAM